jgi:hypothetical protein
MIFSTFVGVFFVFLAFVITALEPRLSARSVRLASLRAADAVPPGDVAHRRGRRYGARRS